MYKGHCLRKIKGGGEAKGKRSRGREGTIGRKVVIRANEGQN